MTNVNLHYNLFSLKFLSIYLHKKIYKNVNIANFVYYQ